MSPGSNIIVMLNSCRAQTSSNRSSAALCMGVRSGKSEFISAERAERIGLYNHVVSGDDLEAEARAMAEEDARKQAAVDELAQMEATNAALLEAEESRRYEFKMETIRIIQENERTLQEERASNEAVSRSDQAHDVDLVPPSEDRDAKRGPDDQGRDHRECSAEDRSAGEPDPPQRKEPIDPFFTVKHILNERIALSGFYDFRYCFRCSISWI